jgi:hypothetical protein
VTGRRSTGPSQQPTWPTNCSERLATELAGEARPGPVTKFSAEIRALDRLVVEFTRRVETGLATLITGKSQRHVNAVNARWKRGI